MPSLVIRVSTAIDRGIDTAYEPFVDAAKRATRQVQETMRRANQKMVSDMYRANKEAAKSFDLIAKAAGTAFNGIGGGKGGAGGIKSQFDDVARAGRKASDTIAAQEKRVAREREAAEKHVAQIRMRYFREQQREEDRGARARESAARREEQSALKLADTLAKRQRPMMGMPSGGGYRSAGQMLGQDRAREDNPFSSRGARAGIRYANRSANDNAREVSASVRSRSRIAGSVAGAARGVASFGGRMAMDLARDVGVETDAGRMAAQNIALQKSAVDLSNSGYMPGKSGANGMRQSAGALMGDARAAGNVGAFSANDAMGGLQKFVAKTGDLETGRNILEDMAKYARATGTDLEDIVDAAGDVNNALGDVANKPEIMKGVMRSIIAQGKEGAVEIKDLAIQMAKLGAAAGQVSGDKAAAMTSMGALTQMTRAKGGAAGASQAATSVGSLMATFTKQARVNAFKANGVQLREADGMLRDPMAIIKDAIHNTGGNAQKMATMFADQGAQRAVRGWTSIYNQAGGGKAGDEAVAREMDHLLKATVAMKEMDESYAVAMKTTEAKIAKLNNGLSKIADEAGDKIIPALLRLTPAILKTADGMARGLELVLGVQDENKDKSDDELQRETDNLRGEIAGDVAQAGNFVEQGESTVDPKKLEKLKKNQGDLAKRAQARGVTVKANAEAAEKGKNLVMAAEMAGGVAGGLAGGLTGPMAGRIAQGVFDIGDATNEAAGGGRAGADGRAIDKQRSERLEQSSRESAETMKRLYDLMASGKLKIETPTTGGSSPTVDASGRAVVP